MTTEIPSSDVLRLGKILALTYSDNDGEALSALRAATFSSKQSAKLLGIRAKIHAHYDRATVDEASC